MYSVKAASLVAVGNSSSETPPADIMRLHDLPRDEFIKVLGYLDAADIVHLALSCRAIYETLQVGTLYLFFRPVFLVRHKRCDVFGYRMMKYGTFYVISRGQKTHLCCDG